MHGSASLELSTLGESSCHGVIVSVLLVKVAEPALFVFDELIDGVFDHSILVDMFSLTDKLNLIIIYFTHVVQITQLAIVFIF